VKAELDGSSNSFGQLVFKKKHLKDRTASIHQQSTVAAIADAQVTLEGLFAAPKLRFS
jgi:hypothetical protein